MAAHQIVLATEKGDERRRGGWGVGGGVSGETLNRLNGFMPSWGEEDSPLAAPAGSTGRISSAYAGGTGGRWPSLST